MAVRYRDRPWEYILRLARRGKPGWLVPALGVGLLIAFALVTLMNAPPSVDNIEDTAMPDAGVSSVTTSSRILYVRHKAFVDLYPWYGMVEVENHLVLRIKASSKASLGRTNLWMTIPLNASGLLVQYCIRLEHSILTCKQIKPRATSAPDDEKYGDPAQRPKHQVLNVKLSDSTFPKDKASYADIEAHYYMPAKSVMQKLAAWALQIPHQSPASPYSL